MDINEIGTQLLFCTVPIWAEKKEDEKVSLSTGTGFIFNYIISENKNILLLITSLHVLDHASKVILEFHGKQEVLPDKTKRTRVEVTGEFISRYSEFAQTFGKDIVAIPISPIVEQLMQQKKEIFFRSISQQHCIKDSEVELCGAIEDVTIIGYPFALYDKKNWLPIVRKGITATPLWNDFEEEKAFLIDAGIFPGSSGSPVFLFNQGSYATAEGLTVGTRLAFIGIISETYQDQSKAYLRIGKVIKSNLIIDFLNQFISHFVH